MTLQDLRTQLVCAGREIANYYPNGGKVVVGGRQTAVSQAFQRWVKTGFAARSFTGKAPDS